MARLDAAAVKDAERAGNSSIQYSDFATDEGVHFLRLRGGGGAAGADRPDRFVGEDRVFERTDAGGGHDRAELLGDDDEGLAAVALFQRLADAQDRDQSVLLRARELFGDAEGVFVVQGAALGVADEGVRGADVADHRGGRLARVGALLVLAHVLGAEDQARVGVACDKFGQVDVRRQDGDVDRVERVRCAGVGDRIDQFVREGARAVHLPVSGDELAT